MNAHGLVEQLLERERRVHSSLLRRGRESEVWELSMSGGEEGSLCRDDDKSLYSVLGIVDKRATEEELKKAYRKAVLRTHPDKVGQDSNESERESKEAFLNVQKAWTTLSDPKTRYRYDEQLLREEEDIDDVEADKEVDLADMKPIDGSNSYGYGCRCGDTFVLEEEDKPEKGTSILIPCCSCSLILCINNDVV